MMLGINAIRVSVFACTLFFQPASRARQINLKLFGKNLNFTLDVGTLGLIVTIVLLALLIGAILLAMLARRRARQAQAISRKLHEQIAERERVQKSLTDTQQRTQAIIETAIDGIITMNDEGRIVEFNPAAEQIFGHHRNDVTGKLLAEVIIPPELRESHRRGLEKYLATGEGPALDKRLEVTGLKSDGSSVLLELSIVRMPGGDVPMFTGFVRDITERKRSEQKAHSQLVRLDLLQQITRAIAERQDLKSIFQVVLRRLEENLPLDFTCVCLYDPATQTLEISQIGSRNEKLTLELATSEHSSIDLEENAMAPVLQGQLVYEPDISRLNFPFATKLGAAGLRSLAVAPLPIEGKVFGLIIAARNDVKGFSSSDCEFMRQLSEHVALAAHQAQLYQALQQAYEDLRQTQQAVLEQERLRALGQMASGIAHDINNAISPIVLYTESLLDNEPNLSSKARHALETIQRAIDDVAATVSRMREFSRRPEQQKALQPVDLNRPGSSGVGSHSSEVERHGATARRND
ncbi:MAG TPA: PAS domain S-box protein [Pyrinomonadaceae bacterium]|jgi:PAS domain S-box-containing protein|nr:PAS domain S-box protein [Pyrinomonadaceae bacterium]